MKRGKGISDCGLRISDCGFGIHGSWVRHGKHRVFGELGEEGDSWELGKTWEA